MNINTVLWH